MQMKMNKTENRLAELKCAALPEPKPTDGGDGRRHYDRNELRAYFGSWCPYLKELYRQAGYEEALALEDRIVGDDYGVCRVLYEGGELASEFANCFLSGAWQVWNGDGADDMMPRDDFFGSGETAGQVVRRYEGSARCIPVFIEAAKGYISRKEARG